MSRKAWSSSSFSVLTAERRSRRSNSAWAALASVLKNPPDEDGRKLRPAVCEIVVIFFSGLLSAQRSRCRWRGRCERLHLICHRIALALLGSIAELDGT